jgi:hypothetical protein
MEVVGMEAHDDPGGPTVVLVLRPEGYTAWRLAQLIAPGSRLRLVLEPDDA